MIHNGTLQIDDIWELFHRLADAVVSAANGMTYKETAKRMGCSPDKR